MKKPKLSIIIPHYNSMDSLIRLIKSIPADDDFQIIVVDDNSILTFSDLKAYVLRSAVQEPEIYINSAGIKGAGTCRNIGIDHAKGEWILFADADDYFLDSFRSVVSAKIESDYDLVFFRPTSVYEETNETAQRHIHYERIIYNYLNNPINENLLRLKYTFGAPWSKMIRRSLVIRNEIRFDEVIAGNDRMFSAKVSYFANSIDATANQIYCVTRSKGSITTTLSPEVLDSKLHVFIRLFEFLKRNLSTSDFKALNFSGRKLILDALLQGFGVSKVIEVAREMRKSGIQIVTFQFLNPLYIFNRLVKNSAEHRKKKRFYIK